MFLYKYTFYAKCLHNLPKQVVDYIIQYILIPPYRIVPWVDRHRDQLDWEYINSNPRATEFLIQNPQYIRWKHFSANPTAIWMLEKHLHQVDWNMLCLNPKAIHLLERNPASISWIHLSQNSNAIHLLLQHPDKIHWLTLTANKKCSVIYKHYPSRIVPHFVYPSVQNIQHVLRVAPQRINWDRISEIPEAFPLIQPFLYSRSWKHLAKNPEAIDLLQKNPTRIYWKYLSTNSNAVSLLQEHIERISIIHLCSNLNGIELIEYLLASNYITLQSLSWSWISRNPQAISFLEKHQPHIEWKSLSRNPSIWIPDKELWNFAQSLI